MKLTKNLIRTVKKHQNKWRLFYIGSHELENEILDRIDIPQAFNFKKSKVFYNAAKKYIIKNKTTQMYIEEYTTRINNLIEEMNDTTSEFFQSITEINVKEELLKGFREE